MRPASTAGKREDYPMARMPSSPDLRACRPYTSSNSGEAMRITHICRKKIKADDAYFQASWLAPAYCFTNSACDGSALTICATCARCFAMYSLSSLSLMRAKW